MWPVSLAGDVLVREVEKLDESKSAIASFGQDQSGIVPGCKVRVNYGLEGIGWLKVFHGNEMAYASFSQFLAALDKAGELERITIPVETDLVIAEWADREMKSPGGGKALLFEQPLIDGQVSKFPVAINTMGSEKRMALALQVENIADLAQEISLILKAKPPTDLREGWTLLKQGMNLLHARPKHVKSAPCQEVIHRFDEAMQDPDFTIHDLPVLKCWPKDGGRFITLPNVHTRDPETGARNLGMYRMQVYDDRTTGMHWQVHKVGARHGKLYYERNERMPVTVTIGGDPAYTFAATAPLPDGLDEILFAGFVRKKSVELVKCLTNDLEVPADVDFVLEGYVQPGEMRPEGPFGDHTGFYTAVEDYPVFHLTAITHRRERGLSDDDRRSSADGGFLSRLRQRANFSAGFQNELPRNRRYGAAGRRCFSQPRFRQHSQAIPLSGVQGHARALGNGTNDVQQIHRGGGRRLRRAEHQ